MAEGQIAELVQRWKGQQLMPDMSDWSLGKDIQVSDLAA